MIALDRIRLNAFPFLYSNNLKVGFGQARKQFLSLLEYTMIRIKSLGKVFRKVPAIQNINLEIEENDVFGVIGPSGAGKSTLIRCLARLTEPTTGEILINETPIQSIQGKSLREYHRSIGMIFQHFNLMQAKTAAQNIGYPLDILKVKREEKEKRVKELLEFVNLTAKSNAYPAQLNLSLIHI